MTAAAWAVRGTWALREGPARFRHGHSLPPGTALRRGRPRFTALLGKGLMEGKAGGSRRVRVRGRCGRGRPGNSGRHGHSSPPCTASRRRPSRSVLSSTFAVPSPAFKAPERCDGDGGPPARGRWGRWGRWDRSGSPRTAGPVAVATREETCRCICRCHAGHDTSPRRP